MLTSWHSLSLLLPVIYTHPSYKQKFHTATTKKTSLCFDLIIYKHPLYSGSSQPFPKVEACSLHLCVHHCCMLITTQIQS